MNEMQKEIDQVNCLALISDILYERNSTNEDLKVYEKIHSTVTRIRQMVLFGKQ
jgi:hypothetical protein